MPQAQATELAKRSLTRAIWRLFRFIIFFSLPVSGSFLLWLHFRTDDFSSLRNSNLTPLIPFAAKQILEGYPFSKMISGFLIKSADPHTILLSDTLNGIVKSLLTYTLVDSAKALFRIRNETALIETRTVRIAKLICLYGTWTVLCAFVADLLVSDGFQRVSRFLSPNVSWTAFCIGLCVMLFAVSVLRFRHFTKARWSLSVSWVLTDKLLFSVVAGFLLTLLTMWGYNQFQKDGIPGIILPLVIYILIAATMDLLRNKVRFLIVSLFSNER